MALSSFNSLTLASIFVFAKSVRATPWTILILEPSDRVGNEQINPFSILQESLGLWTRRIPTRRALPISPKKVLAPG